MTHINWDNELDRARKMVAACCEKLDMHGLHITVEWNARFTRRMGDAKTVYFDSERFGRLRGGSIRLSKPLWPNATPQERDQTIKHEAAHIIANLRHKRCVGHKWQWKKVMTQLGLEPKRCHAVDRTGLTSVYSLKCPGCSKILPIGKRVYKNWVEKYQVRRCRHCRHCIAYDYVKETAKLSN